MTTFAMMTLGCKVNAYESAVYEKALMDKGYICVNPKEVADIYVINSCAVTNTAAPKSRQKIHQAKALNPNAIIAVCGCYAQTHAASLEKEGVDVLIGSSHKNELADAVETALKGKAVQVPLENVRQYSVFESMNLQQFMHQCRAFLKIQDGCNQFCSYCIIPYARGMERSMPLEEVVHQAKQLVKYHKEIVLSGIHTGRYGRDLNTNLLALLKELVKIDGLERIRISSIEMNELSDDLLQFIANEPKIGRNLHIPIQSAQDNVLKRMNRQYDMQYFSERMAYIRNLMPDISISSDVIVGFPGESEEEFEETLKNIESLKFSFLHVFPFSKRDHTPAAKMPCQWDNKTKKQRVRRLSALSNELYEAYQRQFIGKTLKVLIETINGDELNGHASEYFNVKVKGNASYLNQMKDVQITHYENGCLYGMFI